MSLRDGTVLDVDDKERCIRAVRESGHVRQSMGTHEPEGVAWASIPG
jgi:hypothetical protein